MSLADPLAKDAFADLLRLASTKFTLMFNQERSMKGGGDVLYADLGPALWMAECVTVPMLHSEAKGIIALINSRKGGLETFLLYDHSMPYPSSDDDGSDFGAATPVVGTITDRYNLAFTAFPASYSMPLGTYFQIIYSTSKYYLGQFAEAKTANGSGAISAVRVAPKLPDAVATSDAVTVLKPSGKFKIVPGSAFVSAISAVHSTVSFAAEQTLAA